MFYPIAVSFSGLYGIFLFFQVFLDVVESVNILVNSNGQIVRSDVIGALKMRTYLRFALFWDIYVFMYVWVTLCIFLLVSVKLKFQCMIAQYAVAVWVINI